MSSAHVVGNTLTLTSGRARGLGVDLSTRRIYSVAPGKPDASSGRDLQRTLITGVGVSDDPHSRVRGENPLEAIAGVFGPVSHHDHPGVDREADPDAAAVVH